MDNNQYASSSGGELRDSMNKKLVVLVVIFLAIPIAFVSHSLRPMKMLQYNKNFNNDDMNSDLIVVGFSQLGSESDWRTANTKSIQSALTEENGFSLIFSNGRQKQENQIKDIRSFIFQEVDYIIIAPVMETGWNTVLEEAREAGIPVIIVDRMIDTQDEKLYVACVGTDKYVEGKKAGLWLEKYLEENESSGNVPGNKGSTGKEVNIAVLEGTANSTAQLGRSKGFEEIAARNNNWNILAHESGDFTKARGKEVMAQYLREFDHIDVLVSQNDDMTFGAIEAIQEAGLTCGINGDITVISFDAVAEAFDKMEEGLINVDIECNPLQGPLIAEVIKRLEREEMVDRISYVNERVFEAGNASIDRVGRSY